MKKQRSEYSELLFQIVKGFGKNPESLRNAAQVLNDVATTLESARKNKGTFFDEMFEKGVKYYEEECKADVTSCFSWALMDTFYEYDKGIRRVGVKRK